MWLIVILASLVALFLLVFSVPLDLAFHLDIHGKTRSKLKLVWLFGLVSKELERKKKAKLKKAKPKKGKERKGGARIALNILCTKGLPSQIKTFITDVFHSFGIRQFRANLRVGLDNPADTGLLFAFIGPTFVFLNTINRYSINIEPSFENEAILEGYIQAVVRLVPIMLVVPLLKFVFSLPTLRVIKAAVSDKWKRKR